MPNDKVRRNNEWAQRQAEIHLLPEIERYYGKPVQPSFTFGPIDTIGIDGTAGGRKLAFRTLKMFDDLECPCPTIRQYDPPRAPGYNESDYLMSGNVQDYWFARIWHHDGACVFAVKAGMMIRDLWEFEKTGTAWEYHPNATPSVPGSGFYVLPNYRNGIVFAKHHPDCRGG